MTASIITASRKEVAAFLALVKKKGGAISAVDFLGSSEEKKQHVAAERALNENLVRSQGRVGRSSADEIRLKHAPSVAKCAEIHLTTEGEKFLKDWNWRWWRWVALPAGLAVTAESVLSLVRQCGN